MNVDEVGLRADLLEDGRRGSRSRREKRRRARKVGRGKKRRREGAKGGPEALAAECRGTEVRKYRGTAVRGYGGTCTRTPRSLRK